MGGKKTLRFVEAFLVYKVYEDEGGMFQPHGGGGNSGAKQTWVQMLTLPLTFSEAWFPYL